MNEIIDCFCLDNYLLLIKLTYKYYYYSCYSFLEYEGGAKKVVNATVKAKALRHLEAKV